MKGIVWGNTFKNASNKLNEVEENYKRYRTANLIRKIKTKN